MWICAAQRKKPFVSARPERRPPSRPESAKARRTTTYPQTTGTGKPFATIAALISGRRTPIAHCLIRTRVRLVLGTRGTNHTHPHTWMGNRLCARIRVAARRDRGAGMVRLGILGRVAVGIGLHGGMCRDTLRIRGVRRGVGRASGVVGGGGLLVVRVHRKRASGAWCVPRRRRRRRSARDSSGVLVGKLKSAQMRRGGLAGLVRGNRPRQLLWCMRAERNVRRTLLRKRKCALTTKNLSNGR